jgi:pimeloyl-ACP methyl ester carboxylesterase
MRIPGTISLLTSLGLLALSCAPKKSVEVKNGNVNISYKLSGKGDTTIVLVHGWCIDKGYWKETQEALSNQYTVVALDLGGHGQSGHNRVQWTVEEFANDVGAVINTLDLRNVVLVGHSMGGDIILQCALNMPDRIVGFVGIDNFKDFGRMFTSEQEKEIKGFINELKLHYKAAATGYSVAALFPPNYTDTVSVNRVIESIQAEDSVISVQAIESAISYYLKEPELVPKLHVRIHLISSDYTPTNEDKLKEYCTAGYSLRIIKGVGHYPMIEKPAEFISSMNETLRDIHREGLKELPLQ